MVNANELIQSEWFDNLLEEVGFNKTSYPKNQIGYIYFLMSKHIHSSVMKSDTGWWYSGYDELIEDVFTQDYNDYPNFEICYNTAIIECMSYLANKKK
jgi:hypothetical protein